MTRDELRRALASELCEWRECGTPGACSPGLRLADKALAVLDRSGLVFPVGYPAADDETIMKVGELPDHEHVTVSRHKFVKMTASSIGSCAQCSKPEQAPIHKVGEE